MLADGTGLGGLVLLFFLFRLFSSLGRRSDGPPPAIRENGEPPPPYPPPPERRLYRLPEPLPGYPRFGHWWRRTFRSRGAVEGEWLLDFDEEAGYTATLPVPRNVVRLDFVFEAAEPLPLEDVSVQAVDDLKVAWYGRWRVRGKQARLRLEFPRADRIKQVKVTTGLHESVECNVDFALLERHEPDATLLMGAAAARKLGSAEDFRRNLEAYEIICDTNPVTALHLAHLSMVENKDDLAELHALRAMGLNRIPPALQICQELANRRTWKLEPERIEELKKELAGWELDGHHGLTVLTQSRSFAAGPGGFVRERFHAAYLVRRKAAARKFRSLSVPFPRGAGGLIHTEAQVRRADGTVEELADDRFTVGSAQDDNPFIAVDRRRSGMWILNDLAPGDIVEMTWDTVGLGRNADGRRDVFMLANVGDTETPTLRADVSFTAPDAWNLTFAVRNTEPGNESATAPTDGWMTTTFSRRRILPRRSHSLPYQPMTLNPLVAGALAGPNWEEVGRALLEPSREAVAATTELPAPLAAACDGDGGPRELLARAFYWVRDRIKYASTASGNRDLGSPERAERIVAARMGDCKDVSLLLAVVCAHHGIPWEFVLMSAENGILLEELPVDQFDHMLVRAQVDGAWMYLDAAGDASVFGSPPFPYQGVPVLTGADGGTVAVVDEIPLERTRVVIHERIEALAGGRLEGRVELRLEGFPARMIEEFWKHESLVSLDPDRAADQAIRHLLPDFEISSLERLADTTTSDVLHVTVDGRRGRLVPLDGQRIVALSFGAPGLPTSVPRQLRYQERYAFLLRAEVVYRLEVAGPVRAVLRGISTVADLATSFCSITEERSEHDGVAGIVRRILITDRVVSAGDLAALPTTLERIEEAAHVVVSLAGEGQAAGA